MKRRLSLLAATAISAVWSWANIEIEYDTVIIDSGWTQLRGRIGMTINDADFYFVSPCEPSYIRFRIVTDCELSETRVGPSADPWHHRPINLALRLISDDASQLIAPPDAIQIVRWKAQEREFWLQVNHGDFWIRTPEGQIIEPDGDHQVAFDIGITWQLSEHLNRDLIDAGKANLPFNQFADGQPAPTTLIVHDCKRYSASDYDMIAFNGKTKRVTTADWNAQIRIGDNTSANFSSRTDVVRLGEIPLQQLTHIPSLLFAESELVVSNLNPWPETLELRAHVIDSRYTPWTFPIEVGAQQTEYFSVWDLLGFFSFAVQSYSVVDRPSVNVGINLPDFGGKFMAQDGQQQWGSDHHLLKVMRDSRTFHGLAIFGLEEGTSVFMELIDGQGETLQGYLLRSYLPPAERELVVLDLFVDAYPQAQWIKLSGEKPFAVDSLAGSERPSPGIHFLTPSHTLRDTSASLGVDLVPVVGEGTVIHAWNQGDEVATLRLEGFDESGRPVGVWQTDLEAGAIVTYALDDVAQNAAYARIERQQGVAAGYGFSALDPIVKSAHQPAATHILLPRQKNHVTYEAWVVNLGKEDAQVDIIRRRVDGVTKATAREFIVPGGIVLGEYRVIKDYALEFVSDQPLAVHVFHQSRGRKVEAGYMTLERPLFEDMTDVTDPILRLQLRRKFDLDGDQVLAQNEINAAKFFRCHDCNITELDGIERLVNLEWLSLSRNRIDRLPDLSALTMLEKLDLDRNHLTEIPSLAQFESMWRANLAFNPAEVSSQVSVGPKLGLLDLRGLPWDRVPDVIGNERKLDVYLNVDSASVQRCRQLESPDESVRFYGYFESRRIQCLGVPCATIEGLHFADPTLEGALLNRADFDGDGVLCRAEADSLEELELVGEGIRSLDGLAQLANLRELDCSHNQIASLTGLSGTQLEVLDVSHNQLSQLPDLSVVPLNTLNLAGNRLQSVQDLPETLTYLDVSSNELTQLDGILRLTALNSLDISSNGLSVLPSLDNLEALYWLDVSVNQLSRLPDFNFGLWGLVASHNRLDDVPYIQSASLHTLDLSHNRLTSLDSLQDKVQILNLDVSHNQLSDVRAVFGVTSKCVDLSHNLLTDVPYFEPYRSQSPATCLDISNNELDENDCAELSAWWRENPREFVFNPQADGQDLGCFDEP